MVVEDDQDIPGWLVSRHEKHRHEKVLFPESFSGNFPRFFKLLRK